MVRAMRTMDALALGLLRRPSGRELTARTWPKAPPESYHPSLLRLFSSLLSSYAGDRRMGVFTEDNAIRGLVLSRSRATGIVWDVEHLVATEIGPAVELLTWACDGALMAGGRRVFLETPPDDLGATAAQRAGFERYSGGTMYRLEPGFSRDSEDVVPARPRLSSDEQGLFQLYNAAVPAPVRAA